MSNLCWIRRDLRLHDHAALSHALKDGETTLVFIFDPHILDKLQDKLDRRVTFIYQSLQEIESELQKKNSSLIIRYGNPEEEIPKLVKELKIKKVFTNRDYEPYAKDRDQKVAKKLAALNVELETFKDIVIFEGLEVVKNDGTMYKVFTPYKNKWLEKFEENDRNIPEFKVNLKNLREFKNPKNILEHNWYKEMGFIETPPLLHGGTKSAKKRIAHITKVIDEYKTARDFPAVEGTSLVSVYIRHGNISIRDLLRTGTSENSLGAKTWVSELIWREFYQMILDQCPYIEKAPFKEQYGKIKWLGSKKDFEAWCEGRTGFPIVDAAMRCLNQTGMMHNRLRMIVASFLCKTLLVNWQLGEKYFAEKLLDYDLAANNGGWQWSSSSGCDAQPYFRIFNPYAQSEKFDPKGEFIKTWIPELANIPAKKIHKPDGEYITPIVSYEINRKRALSMYAVVKS